MAVTRESLMFAVKNLEVIRHSSSNWQSMTLLLFHDCAELARDEN